MCLKTSRSFLPWYVRVLHGLVCPPVHNVLKIIRKRQQQECNLFKLTLGHMYMTSERSHLPHKSPEGVQRVRPRKLTISHGATFTQRYPQAMSSSNLSWYTSLPIFFDTGRRPTVLRFNWSFRSINITPNLRICN